MTLIEELQWRGLIHDIIPGTEAFLEKEKTTGYVGFDPTSDSLHVGNLVPIILLMHLQKSGHRPIALVGGATGLVGDPSGKSEERKLLSVEELNHNLSGIKKQLEKFLDFSNGNALILNNYDWFKDFSFLDFIRDVGKHITINYMLSKDSVKKRMETGMSFTEFTYQLVQGYDFYHLYKNYDCKLQMGGSDQWGNITTGTELIRRKAHGEAYAFTAPLITKADGGKFGKTEQGNVWLDASKTSSYHFYQFWLNTSDEDAERYIKIFTFLPKEEIESIIQEHHKAPHLRLLQKRLSEDLTVRIHSKKDYENAVAASEILFGKSTFEQLQSIDEQTLLAVFKGVPNAHISKSSVEEGIHIIDFLSETTGFLKSKGEARRALKERSIAVNKQKVNEDKQITSSDLIMNKYIILQRGKKNYFLAIAQ